MNKPMNKIVVAYIDNTLNRIKNNLGSVSDVLNMCSPEGYRKFDEYAKLYESEEAKLSDLQKEYRKYFRDNLKSFGVVSPNELNDKEKSDFFLTIKNGWENGKGRIVEEGEDNV